MAHKEVSVWPNTLLIPLHHQGGVLVLRWSGRVSTGHGRETAVGKLLSERYHMYVRMARSRPMMGFLLG